EIHCGIVRRTSDIRRRPALLATALPALFPTAKARTTAFTAPLLRRKERRRGFGRSTRGWRFLVAQPDNLLQVHVDHHGSRADSGIPWNTRRSIVDNGVQVIISTGGDVISAASIEVHIRIDIYVTWQGMPRTRKEPVPRVLW